MYVFLVYYKCSRSTQLDEVLQDEDVADYKSDVHKTVSAPKGK